MARWRHITQGQPEVKNWWQLGSQALQRTEQRSISNRVDPLASYGDEVTATSVGVGLLVVGYRRHIAWIKLLIRAIQPSI